MNLTLKYGSVPITLTLPDTFPTHILRPHRPPVIANTAVFFRDQLGPQLAVAADACRNARVLVLLADGTRDQPHLLALSALTPLLQSATAVTVLLATGTHRSDTPENRALLDKVAAFSTANHIPLCGAAAHNCRTAEFHDFGATPAGTRVRLNARIADADAILIISDTVPHYFAGYSNAVKFLLPGIAAFESVEHNHAFALDPAASYCRHPLHDDPARRNNPVANDQFDAARLVTADIPAFALVMASSGDAITWAAFDRLGPAVATGIRFVDRHLVTAIDRRYRRIVISCGGHPNDETLYIAQRSLELCQEIIADHAEILWLAECRNGIASSQTAIDNFFTPLKTGPDDYIRRVREKYVMFSHKTVRFAALLDRIDALHVVSTLPSGTLPVGRMLPCPSAQAVVDRWTNMDGEPILVIDEANKQAVTLKT